MAAPSQSTAFAAAVVALKAGYLEAYAQALAASPGCDAGPFCDLAEQQAKDSLAPARPPQQAAGSQYAALVSRIAAIIA